MKRHILVIGDLSIDHDVCVTELESRDDSGAVELCFKVVRRQDTAGSAANSARILAALNDGETYLWGIVGTSHWGTFREVLERSQSIDGTDRPIHLRGVGDESNPQMNTVTRILVVSEGQSHDVQRRFCRYYDVDHMHVSDAKRETVFYHMNRIQETKTQLHSIVINDFGRRTLTKSLIDAIATRAAHYGIPLVVDPHFDDPDSERYIGIKATAILPNLREWCSLVKDSHGPDYWRRNLNEAEALREMAVQSFQHLSNFTYHVVKCDKDGAVLFFPHPKDRTLYGLYRVEPVPVDEPAPPLQMGCGDVMTAVFALELPKDNATTEEALCAFQCANAAVACYREMPWHRMPSRRVVQRKQETFPWAAREPNAQITKSVLFLPQDRVVNMATCETAVKGLYSKDHTFRATIREFLSDVTERWSAVSMKSMVLGAPPGTGKTTLLKAVRQRGASCSIALVDMTSTENGKQGLHTLSPAEFPESFKRMREDSGHKRLLILVDEALRQPSALFLEQNAPTLLDAAHAEGVRLLFVSAGFSLELERAPEWREFHGRSRTYYLTDLQQRPFDVPYIVAARFLELRPVVSQLQIEGAFLLAVTDLALVTPEPRLVCGVVDDVLRDLPGDTAELCVRLENLPRRHRASRQLVRGDFGTFEFRR